MYEAIQKETGHDLSGKSEDEIRAIAKELHVD
jgi:lysyl-tRNA synthetase, class II